MQVSRSFSLTFIVCCVLFGGAWSDVFGDDPNQINIPQGVFTITSGTASSPCGWEEAFSRYGADTEGSYDGQLTIDIDTCQKTGDYDVYSFPQLGGAGGTAYLIPNDLIIVWDEDSNHGSLEQNKNFDFTGIYKYDPNVIDPIIGYVNLTTTDQRTNWAVYRVTESGVFTKGLAGTNEHEVIHFYDVDFWKEDDLGDPNDCVNIGNTLTYTICYDNISDKTFGDVFIIDYLPAEVTCPSGYVVTDPDDPNRLIWIEDTNYDLGTHTYTWDIGTIYPGDANCVTVTVTVKDSAQPGGILHNIAEMWDTNMLARWKLDTNVCCWLPDGADPNVVYVDPNAPGPHSGTSWQYAYTDLQDAIDRINGGCPAPDVAEIWVAEGICKPSVGTVPEYPDEPDDFYNTFEIPAGVKVYGGYNADSGERNVDRYESILSGLIDETSNNDAVVTMGYGSVIDGVTVTEGEKGVYVNNDDAAVRNCNIAGNSQYGVYIQDCNSMIENCNVTDNQQRGIYAQDGDVTIKWCSVTGNGWYGIEHVGDDYILTIENSQIKRNERHGIIANGSISTVKNCIIASNGAIGQLYYGMYIENPADNPTIYNNTIVYNSNDGIAFIDNGDVEGDPNGSDWPDIQNCIVYFNNESGRQMAGMYPDDVAEYSCIQDCNELNGNINDFPGFAYTVEPNFVEPYPDNYHLAYDSNCIDAGNQSLDYDGQFDIDGENRIYIYEGTVDIGADEVYSCDEPLSEDDIYNALDWNADGIVNFEEFEYFSLAWLSHDPNEFTDPNFIDPDEIANWDAACNLDASGTSEYVIDLADIDIFVDDWLWVACWKQSEIDRVESMMMAMGGGESMMMVPMSMESFAPAAVEQAAPTLEEQAAQLLKMLDWLDEIWLDPEVQESIDEEDWLDFVESVEESFLDIIELQE